MSQETADPRPGSTVRPPVTIRVASIGDGALWLAAFLSGFVIREPAPYELYLAGLTVVWLAFGLKLRREIGPLIICLMLYISGGIASIPLASEMGDAVIYIAVSGFLAVTAIFYAAILAERPERYSVIEKGYLAGSVLVALIGIAGYFNLFPGADFFTRYGRARGTFEDPNVFGPFLALPTVLFMHRLLNKPMREVLAYGPALAILVLAIFLSFSRGAWGVIAIATLVVYLLSLITERKAARRLRLVALGAAGILAVIALLGVVLTIDSVSEMFVERAKLVQEYDGARLGRFARYALGFQMVMENPLGIGALEFNKHFPEDEHNVYLKGFTTYGWIGGLAYIVLAGWTMKRLVPLLFKHRPWTPFLHCVFAVFTAHLILSVIIDTDHWRHMYMLYGISWGLIGADMIEQKRLSRMRAPA
ncbi:O-antigen ligase family protein [Roseibium sp.]|uniref:O-antigen ligase family protein n=1 Tax=Roseibium sp. TaxID=1936156 RepID=UPI003A984BA2